MFSTRNSLIALGSAMVIAGPAAAGGIAPVVVEPAPVIIPAPVAVAADWSGFYGGLSYSQTMGSLDAGAGATDFEDGTAPGAFAGYNWQNGNFVFGGELAYHAISDSELTGTPGTELSSAIDLKGRLGYAAGRVMPYLALGYSSATLDVGADSFDLTGASYGIGVDFLVTDNIFVGAEYLQRDLSGDGYEADPSTLGIRVGYKF